MASLKKSERKETFKEGFKNRRDHKNEVALSEEQRHAFHRLIWADKAPVRKLADARILLTIDRHTVGTEWTDGQVAAAIEISRSTVMRVRKRFGEYGLDDASASSMCFSRSHPHLVIQSL